MRYRSISVSEQLRTYRKFLTNKERSYPVDQKSVQYKVGFFLSSVFLVQNKSFFPKITHLLLSTCIRPVLEYCAPLYNHAFSANLSEDQEHIQKSALSVIRISPGLSYHVILELYNIRSLQAGAKNNVLNSLTQSYLDTAHKLHHLLPPNNISRHNFRNQRNFMLLKMDTNRYTNTFNPSMSNR